VTAVSKYLIQKGVPIPPIIPAYNQSFVEFEGRGYFLSPWIDGTCPNYDEPGMVRDMTRLLATFHQRSLGYYSSGGPICEKLLLRPKEYTTQQLNLLNLRNVSWKNQEFSVLFQNHYEWISARAQWVIDHFPHNTFKRLVENAKKDPMLIHGDYSKINLILKNDGHLTIIDLDTISMALPVWELSRFIKSVGIALQGNVGEIYELILNAYQDLIPLSCDEQQLVHLDMVFPWYAINYAMYFRNNQNNTKYLETFKLILAFDQQIMEFIQMGPNNQKKS